VHKGAKEN